MDVAPDRIIFSAPRLSSFFFADNLLVPCARTRNDKQRNKKDLKRQRSRSFCPGRRLCMAPTFFFAQTMSQWPRRFDAKKRGKEVSLPWGLSMCFLSAFCLSL
ncbi:hypothetical protein [Pandoravirus japonicus]|uniref:Uncharacterized protein n=1 Tax=Pandoravirus japonicus TaxID=2823154 RepID=A0A811BP07_9VIRU|nr:hypothetical protein [Pandoravirus japonicus]